MEDPSSSQGASPVSPSHKPDSDKELRMKRVVISGQKCTELFPILKLSGSLAKMCQGLLHFPWYSRERLLTWKHQAIRQSVSIFQLAPRTLNTNDNDSGLSATFPTPTAMDTKKDALKYATKMMQGKTHRASGQPIQTTLSDKVMMEEIKKNPKLMKVYQNYEMTERPSLPPQEQFVTYLRSQTSIKELAKKTQIKKTKIEHWFRRDKAGFSHPSIEDWTIIKPYLKEIQFDYEMTHTVSKEWESKNMMFPTPRVADTEGGLVKNVELKDGSFSRVNKEGVRWGVKLKDAVNYLEMYPTPATRDYKGTNSYERTKQKIEQGERGHMGQLPNYIMMKEGEKSEASLNPDWVESYLMDYPIGWTRVSSEFQESQPKSKTEQHDSKQLEMPSSPQSQKSSQEQS